MTVERCHKRNCTNITVQNPKDDFQLYKLALTDGGNNPIRIGLSHSVIITRKFSVNLLAQHQRYAALPKYRCDAKCTCEVRAQPYFRVRMRTTVITYKIAIRINLLCSSASHYHVTCGQALSAGTSYDA